MAQVNVVQTIRSIADMENVTSGIIDALNRRDLSPDSPAWVHVAPSWTSQVMPLAPNAERTTFDLPEHLEMCKRVYRIYPDYHMEIESMNTYLSEETGRANVFCNFKVTGIERDLVRLNAGIIKFKYMDGKWMAAGYRAAMGVTGVPALE